MLPHLQQRLFALKVFLFPKVYHHMVLGRVTISSLNEIDKTVRELARQWIALPNDTPIAYFHLRSSDRRRTGNSISEVDGPPSKAEKTDSSAPSP